MLTEGVYCEGPALYINSGMLGYRHVWLIHS